MEEAMSASERSRMHRAVNVVLASAVALGLAACEKKPAPAPAPAAAKPLEAPPAPPKVAPQAAPAAAQPPAESGADMALAAKVKAALGGVKGLESGTIDVQASGGQVKLYGTADNAAVRDEAAKAASAVPGVKSVENHVAVVAGS
jgi:BON domain